MLLLLLTQKKKLLLFLQVIPGAAAPEVALEMYGLEYTCDSSTPPSEGRSSRPYNEWIGSCHWLQGVTGTEETSYIG
jgi:hypothetical protein